MTDTQPIHNGIRGTAFEQMIKNILGLSGFEIQLDPEKLAVYETVFTDSSVSTQNYEYYEFIGDATVNKCIVWYTTQRFPHLRNPDGVKVLARLKINLVSRRSFATLAKKFGFIEYITYQTSPKISIDRILEDVFEAFFGATEELFERGFDICKSIITRLLNSIDISLRYTDLFDAKTRLKEVFDMYNMLNGLKYIDTNTGMACVCEINGSKVTIATINSPPYGKYAQQLVSELAIAKLEKLGYIKPIPSGYEA